MKKVFRNLTIILLTAFAVISCAKDGVIEPGVDPGTGDALSFVLKGFRSNDGVTYADRIASEAEDKIESLDIYMFNYVADGTGTFVEKFSFTDTDLRPVGSDKVISLGRLSEASYGTGKKVYYFVANGSYTTALNAASMDEKSFSNELTAALTGELRTPLLFSGRSNPMGLVGTGTVQLMRRVARFDLVNDYHEELDITSITVNKPATQGYVFNNNTGSAAIATSGTDYVKSLSGLTYEEKPNTAGTGNEWIVESLFYLYPTEIPATTKITVEGTYDSQKFVYHINTPVDILANHRYKLIASKGAELSFNLVVLDWDEGGDKDLEFMEEIEVSGLRITEGDGTFDNDSMTWVIERGVTNAIEFTATTTSTYGLALLDEVIVKSGDDAGVSYTLTGGTVNTTYANNGYVYTQDMKLTVSDARQAFESELTVYDLIGTDAKLNINVVCEKGEVLYAAGYSEGDGVIAALLYVIDGKYEQVVVLDDSGPDESIACGMCEYNGYVYVAGYTNKAAVLWRYDHSIGEVKALELNTEDMYGANCFDVKAVNGKLYMSGTAFYSGSSLEVATIWEADPDMNTSFNVYSYDNRDVTSNTYWFSVNGSDLYAAAEIDNRSSLIKFDTKSKEMKTTKLIDDYNSYSAVNMAIVNNDIYITGSFSNNESIFWQYSITSERVVNATTISDVQFNYNAFAINNKAYVSGIDGNGDIKLYSLDGQNINEERTMIEYDANTEYIAMLIPYVCGSSVYSPYAFTEEQDRYYTAFTKYDFDTDEVKVYKMYDIVAYAAMAQYR